MIHHTLYIIFHISCITYNVIYYADRHQRWCNMQYMICNIWYATYDMQYMICNIWYAIYDMQYMICNIWYAIYDMLYMICNILHIICCISYIQRTSYFRIHHVSYFILRMSYMNMICNVIYISYMIYNAIYYTDRHLHFMYLNLNPNHY